MLTLDTPNLSEIVVLLKFKTQSIDEKGALYLKNMLTLDTSDYPNLLTDEMVGTQHAPFLIEGCVLNNREMEV